MGMKAGGAGICVTSSAGELGEADSELAENTGGGTFAGGAVGGIPQSPSLGSLAGGLLNPRGAAFCVSSAGGPLLSATVRGAAAGVGVGVGAPGPR